MEAYNQALIKMESIYRTLCFCQKVNNDYRVFYGHSIFWKLTSLDYLVEGWKRKNIKGDVYVFFSDLPNYDLIEELLNNRKVEIETNSKICNLVFDWSQSDKDFLINEGGGDDYKPFISLCSKASYYFSEVNSESVDEFFLERKKSIHQLEKEFFIPLSNNAHLINTFAVYEPTRIETSLRNIRDESNRITCVQFLINDTFHEYQDCEAVFLLTSDGDREEGCFRLCCPPKKINTSFDPDYMELTIKKGEEAVFIEKCYFIKSISINMDVVSGSIKTGSGSVPVHSSSSFKVGNEDV